MASITITLGEEGFEKTYTIRPLPIKAARQWRQQIRGPMSRLLELADGIQLENAQFDNMDQFLGALKALLPRLLPLLLDLLDEVFELLIAYSPELQQDRAYLEDHALDDQVVRAFLQVVRLAFPLESWMTQLPGPASQPTSSNSASRSGISTSEALALNIPAQTIPTSTR